jgi:hypothetical protein
VEGNGEGNTTVGEIAEGVIVMLEYPDNMDGVPKVGDRILGNDTLAGKIFTVGDVNNEDKRITISHGGESIAADNFVNQEDVLSF